MERKTPGVSALAARQPNCPAEHWSLLSMFITGKRTLLLLDIENINQTLKRSGARLRFRALSEFLHAEASTAVLTAFLASASKNNALAIALRRSGFLVTTTPIGEQSADFELYHSARTQVRKQMFDTVVIASGDGRMVRATARAIKQFAPHVGIVTLSVRGSTSHTILKVDPSGLFDGALFINDDLVESVPAAGSLEKAS